MLILSWVFFSFGAGLACVAVDKVVPGQRMIIGGVIFMLLGLMGAVTSPKVGK